MAACANLSGKGWYRLAFLPQQPHQLVIVTICQADGLQMDSIMCTSQSSPTWARRNINSDLVQSLHQLYLASIFWWWYPGPLFVGISCSHAPKTFFSCALKTPEFALVNVKVTHLRSLYLKTRNKRQDVPGVRSFHAVWYLHVLISWTEQPIRKLSFGNHLCHLVSMLSWLNGS